MPMSAGSHARPIKLALVSCGLGRVQRGFEIATARWHAALSSDPRLRVKLFSGGAFPDAEPVWNIARDRLLRSPLGAVRSLNAPRLWRFCYRVEQRTFGLGFIPKLWSWRPDVVWVQDLLLGRVLASSRELLRLKFKIVFANSVFPPHDYRAFDLIQQMHPDALALGVRAGVDAAKMRVLPHYVPYTAPAESPRELRREMQFADDDWIVVCVAAWNSYQKRLDYLIEEAADLRDPSLKLVLCGHPEPGTDVLKTLARDKLGPNVRWLTLAPEDVRRVLAISNVFVLPSLYEGLSLALIEAAMAGVPIICHRHAAGRFVLEDGPWLADLSVKGALAARLRALRGAPPPDDRLRLLQARVAERFGARALADQFYEIVSSVHHAGCAGGEACG